MESSSSTSGSSSGSSSEITVNIKTLDSRTHSLRVPSDILISELKKRIESELSVPVSSQRLIFTGKALKDDQKLSFYSINDGYTIHMVARPPGADQPAPSQPQPRPAGPGTATLPPGAGIPGLFASGRPNVMMSTITLPAEGVTDINQLVSGVINSLGITLAGAGAGAAQAQAQAQAAAGQPAVPPPNSFDTLRQGLANLSTSINETISQTRSTEYPVTNANNLNTVETIGDFIGQYRNEIERLSPALERLSHLLRNESRLQDQPLRTEAQQLSTSAARVFQQLGNGLIALSAVLNQVQVGNTPGAALPAQPPSRVATGNIAIQINEMTQNGVSPAGIAVPVFIHPPGTSPVRPAQGQQGQVQPQPQQAQSQTTQSHPQQGAQAQPQQANPLAALGQMFGPMLQQMQTAGVQGGAQPAQGAPNFANVMNSLLGTLLRPQNPNQPTAAPSTAAPTPEASQSSTSAASSPPIAPPPGTVTGAMMTQMFQAISQSLSHGSTQSANSVINTVANSFEDGTNQDDGPLGEIVKVVMDSLSIPELLAVVSGDWAPFEKVHHSLRDHLVRALGGSATPDVVGRYVDSLMAAFRASLDDRTLPDEIKSSIIIGRNINVTETALTIIRGHVNRVIELILTPADQFQDPTMFARELKKWTRDFIGDLLTKLSQLFSGGVRDVHKLVHYFVSQRLTGVEPDIAAVAVNIITSHIMTTYNDYLALAVQYPTEDQWPAIFTEDERIQSASAGATTQLSDSYLSGIDPKRRNKMKQQPTEAGSEVVDAMDVE